MRALLPIRKAVTGLITTVLVLSATVLAVTPAGATPHGSGDQPAIDVHVMAIVADGEPRIAVDVQGSGFQTVAALNDDAPQETSLALVPRDIDLFTGAAIAMEDRFTATIGLDGTFTSANFTDPFEVAAAALDHETQYAVISWPAAEEPITENLYARADATIDFAVLFPGMNAPEQEAEEGDQAALVEQSAAAADRVSEVENGGDKASVQQPQTTPAAQARAARATDPVGSAATQASGYKLSATATIVPNESVTIGVQGSGFGQVKPLPGQKEGHVYLLLIEKGSSLGDVTQETGTPKSAKVDPKNGTISSKNWDPSGPLVFEASAFSKDKQYEIIAWPSRSNPTEENLYTRVDLDIDMDALFPVDVSRVSSAKVVEADAKRGLTIEVEAQHVHVDGEPVSKVLVGVNVAGKKVTKRSDLVAHTEADVSDGALKQKISLAKAQLQRDTKYEVAIYNPEPFGAITKPAYTIPISEAQWTKVFGKKSPATVKVDKVQVVNTGLKIDVTATSLPEDFVYFAILERGTESKLTQDGGYAGFIYPGQNSAESNSTVEKGHGQFSIVVPKGKLVQSKAYEVLIWRGHSNPTAATIFGRTDINITAAQWKALLRTKPAVPTKPVAPQPTATVGDEQSGSLTWGISAEFVDYTTNKNRAGGKSGGSITTSGVGGGRGGWVFPQASGGSWDKASQTGTVPFSGVVTFSAHKGLMNESFSNPVITVNSEVSGSISSGGRTFALNLGAASKSLGTDGSITWQNVPVEGTISGGGGGGGGSLPVDPLSFTVGVPSNASYGSSHEGEAKKVYTAALTAPATTGLEIITPKEKLVPGARIEMQARGFDPNDENVLVVLYSDPIVLDDTAKADNSGLVTWSGTLPEDVEPGEHVLTLQGSINAGAVFEVVSPKKAERTRAAIANITADERAVIAANVPTAIPNSGLALWEWWAAALGLVAIAGSTSVLAARQRRAEHSERTEHAATHANL